MNDIGKTRISPLREIKPGVEIGGFRIQEEVGRGGMGVVYLADQLNLGRKVALKVIAPDLAQDPDFRSRFQFEAQTAASIDHPNVVPVFEAGSADGILFLSMRYVPGTDLRSLLLTGGPLDETQAASVIAQVGDALDAAHEGGLVHRDVKPGNILFSGPNAESHAYLTDFGLTKESSADTGMTNTGQWVGTVDYVAPEQLEGGLVDARADTYALGCVLFHALSGQAPFSGSDVQKMWAHVKTEPPSLAAISGDLASRYDEVINRAMAKDPDDRYKSAGDLGRAARAAADRERARLTERSVASGAAASGATPEFIRTPGTTRPATQPQPQNGPREPVDPPTQQLPRRRFGAGWVVAGVLSLVVILGGVATGVALTSGSDDKKDDFSVSNQLADTGDSKDTGKPAAAATPPEVATTPPTTQTSSPRSLGPTSYAPYFAAASGGFSAKLPADPGWTVEPEVNQNDPGESPLYRTYIHGPSGSELWIDYTNDQPAGDPDGTQTGTVSVPGFGTVSQGYSPSDCSHFDVSSPCVDYITQIDGGAQGIAVFGYGGDPAVTAAVAKKITRSLSRAGE